MPGVQTPQAAAHARFSDAEGHSLRGRVAIENVQPEINGGQFPAKRSVGDLLVVQADIHADGHDVLQAVLRYRLAGAPSWQETPMTGTANDAWTGQWTAQVEGRYEYAIEAWVDRFMTWRQGLDKKLQAGQVSMNDFLEGSGLIEAAARRAKDSERDEMLLCASRLSSERESRSGAQMALGDAMAALMSRYADRPDAVTYDHPLMIRVEPVDATFSSWYEMFPRSAGPDPLRSATLREAESRLAGIAAMGFSIVYLPPIHPIGKSFRKGPNNHPQARPEDPGSPWAIGSSDGGHKAVDPALGTLEDFDHFVEAAHSAGLQVALDLAYQCSPDHPYIQQHPGWFKHRPDGSLQYAENPPKKYEDIVPFDFECADGVNLWQELKSIVTFWIEHGVRHFRADNPHTKPYRFWEWLISEIQDEYPGTLFLAEAFTRPKIMHYLAKCGFSQSYTYFTWRNTKQELTEYLTELTHAPLADFFRPNFFTNTPDILHAFLQKGGRAAHQIRLVLAATLSASYGIYGPPFELCEADALPDSEDYRDSEKYQIRQWDWNRPGNIKDLITRVNAIRKENRALQSNRRLTFYPVNNESLLAYAKSTPDLSNVILVVVNLDPSHAQEGWLQFSGTDLGLAPGHPIEVHDLLTDARYPWSQPANYVRLDPAVMPAHLFLVRRKMRTERDFDYFQ